MLIQNEEILMILQYLQAKPKRFQDYEVLLRTSQATAGHIFGWHSNRKNLVFRFYNFTTRQKKVFTQTAGHWELNSFTNMFAKIDMDAVPSAEQTK